MSARLTRRSTKKRSEQRDGFSDAWGASTAWRSGVPGDPRQLRLYLAQEHAILPSRQVPAVVDGVASAPAPLEKPLPPIPVGEIPATMSNEPALPTISNSSSTSSQASTAPGRISGMKVPSSSNLSSLMRKLGLPPHSSKKRRALPPSQQSLPQFPSQQSFSTLAVPMPQPREPGISRRPTLVHRTTSSPSREGGRVIATPLSRPAYVDAGTQTSPPLPTQRPKPVPANSSITSLRTITTRRPDIARQESTLSPLSGPKKGFWVKMAPSDYFSVPLLQDKALPPSIPLAGTVSHVLFDRPLARESDSSSSISGDSIGTYESRYSASESGTEILRRPSMSRPALSDSILLADNRSSSSGETQRASVSATTQFRSQSYEQTNVRSLAMPFNKFSSFSGNRGRRKISSEESSSRASESPLRNSLKLPPSPLLYPSGPPTPGCYQHPVVTPEPLESLAFIPDHLKGSPLCPRSPKHPSGGTGFCPMHGKNSVSGESAQLLAVADSSRAIRATPPESLSGSAKSYTDGSVDDSMVRNKHSRRPGYSNRIQDYPGVGHAKGVCIFDGRFVFYLRGSSEDSVTRARLR